LPPQRRLNAAITVATVIAFKDVRDGATHLNVLCPWYRSEPDGRSKRCVQANLQQKILDAVRLFQGINQLRLLPPAQGLPVDAPVFSLISSAALRMSCSSCFCSCEYFGFERA
jgi:hypothetical protein